MGWARENRVYGSRDVNQEINNRENVIRFLTAFYLSMRVHNVYLTKSLYLSQNFVFYSFPNLQLTSLELSIHAEHPYSS